MSVSLNKEAYKKVELGKRDCIREITPVHLLSEEETIEKLARTSRPSPSLLKDELVSERRPPECTPEHFMDEESSEDKAVVEGEDRVPEYASHPLHDYGDYFSGGVGILIIVLLIFLAFWLVINYAGDSIVDWMMSLCTLEGTEAEEFSTDLHNIFDYCKSALLYLIVLSSATLGIRTIARFSSLY